MFSMLSQEVDAGPERSADFSLEQEKYFLNMAESRSLFASFPHDPPKIFLARKYYARRWLRLDEKIIAFDSKMSPLFRAVPLFVPRKFNRGDEVMAFNAVSSRIRDH